MSYYSRKHLELTLDQQHLKDAAGHQKSRSLSPHYSPPRQDHQQWQDRFYDEWLESPEGQRWIDEQAADQQVRQGAY